ncbi:hypothetical protein ACGFR8_21390 [Streptomyces brevispora]|uniref:hypothetical protein n=1 Tax=Streptomyces brevispora TaxID=887462 RepID=UPI003719B001
MSGPPRSPQLHAQEDILVWVPGPQQDARWPPFGAWDESSPARPNWEQPDYRWPEQDPVHTVNGDAYVLRRERYVAGEPREGRVLTVGAHPVLWPPYAELCARVLWQPDEMYERRPDGTVPAGAVEHWNTGTALVRRDLEKAGYLVRQAERPTGPETDDDAGFLVWKTCT